MQSEFLDIHISDAFAPWSGYGARYGKRFRMVAGFSALSFFILGGAELLIFLAGADIVAFLFSHNHSVSDLPFQLQTIVIAGLSFGLCILAVGLTSAGTTPEQNRR